MLIYDDFIKKYWVIIQKFFFAFLNVFPLLSMSVPNFKSINSSSLSKKKYGGGNVTPTSPQRLGGWNTSMGIWLIESAEPSDTLNYKLFFKHWIIQTILHVILLLTFVRNKIFCSKNSYILHFLDLVWGERHSELQY